MNTRRLVLSLSLALALGISAFAQATAPKGTSWKDSLEEGKKDASGLKAPVLMFAFDKNSDDANKLIKSFEDPKVSAVLKVFVCVFVSRDGDLNKFQLSYVPWIGSSASATYNPPLVVFGDSKGNVHQDLRLEGKYLDPAALLEHLYKAIGALAPEKLDAAKSEILNITPLPELVSSLGESFGKLGDSLTADKVNPFQEELKNAQLIAAAVGKKLEGLKDTKEKKFKTQGMSHFNAMKKSFEKLSNFKGKSLDVFKGHLDKAKEAFEAIKQIVEESKG